MRRLQITRILRNKSGLTMLFVLGVMLFLLALSVSAFTAAGLSMGAYITQRDRNQLNLYASSMERTISAALHVSDEETLGRWLIEQALEDFFDDQLGLPEPFQLGTHDSLDLDIPDLAVNLEMMATGDPPDFGGDITFEIGITGYVDITVTTVSPYSPYRRWDEDEGIDAQPLVLNIWSTIIVRQTTEYADMHPLVKETTFRYSGFFREDAAHFSADKEAPPTLAEMIPQTPGGWIVLQRQVLTS